MVEFNFDKDVYGSIEKGNFAIAVLGAHDMLQSTLTFYMQSAYSFLSDFKGLMKFSEQTMRPRSFNTKLINKAHKTGLINDQERAGILRVKGFRDEKVGHHVMFFDKEVQAGTIPRAAVIAIVKETDCLIWHLMAKMQEITKTILGETQRVMKGEDINKVFSERTHNRLLEIVKKVDAVMGYKS